MKVSIGRKRRIEQTEPGLKERRGDWLILVGVGTMAILLATALGQDREAELTMSGSADAVAVMSTVNREAEELVKPEKETYLPKEESIFESIGEFFADLIFGDR